ncbi:MAG: DUF501 domain-containing protein [Spirochaetota bacterium]
MKMKFELPAESDIEILKKEPCGLNLPVYGIAVRCSYGHPLVVVLNPVLNKESGELNFGALSSLLWLTCPKVHAEISRMEESGVIAKVQKMLSNERTMVDGMTDAHAHYYFFRKDIYRQIMGRDYPEEQIRFFDAGIAGIKDAKQVKCLHTHYAHYLVCSENIIGRAVDGALACKECQEGEMLCRK